MSLPKLFHYPNAVDVGAVKQQLSLHRPFYIYILCRPDGRPFYVGKGINYRCLQHEADARTTKTLTHKLNTIRSLHAKNLGVSYVIDSSYDDERLAHARERELIAKIGRHDLRLGPLTNQTDGGEGTSNPSEESRQKRRDSLWGDAADPERQLINKWFQELTPVKSVPIKPVSTFKRATSLNKNRKYIGMSRRQVGSILASAISNQIIIQTGCLIPRRMFINDVEYIIENGAGNDMLSNGIIEIFDASPKNEILELTEKGREFLLKVFDNEKLLDAGVLMPS